MDCLLLSMVPGCQAGGAYYMYIYISYNESGISISYQTNVCHRRSDPQETASRLASQRQEYARGLHTLSKHHLYAGFNGTPAGTAVSSMTSSKKGSASSSTLDKVEKMVDEKKRKKEKKGGGSFWCCGSGH